jgi:hypothetical protein
MVARTFVPRLRVVTANTAPLPLPLPLPRPHRPGERHARRLPPGERGLDEIRREQGHAQDAADIGRVDALRGRDLLDGGVGAGVEQATPAKGAAQGLDQSSANARGTRPARGGRRG